MHDRHSVPMISVIMPVFNAGTTLQKSVDSIISQTFPNWELIVVNDGSTDNSSNILSSYLNKDYRIKVFNQDHSGVSSARQKGIDEANGKYCIHLDSDDWAESDFLETLFHVAEESDADLVWCDVYKNSKDRETIWTHFCEEDSSIMIRSILSGLLWGSLWNRLIRTDICHREDVLFPKHSQMREDTSFVCQVLIHCRVIRYVKKPLYHYYIANSESLLHQQFHKNFDDDIRKSLDQLEIAFKKNGITSFDYELTWNKLLSIRNFIDDKGLRDYNNFLNTYPEAIAKINEYKNYPQRLKIIVHLLHNHQLWMIPVVMKLDGILKRLGVYKDNLTLYDEKKCDNGSQTLAR